MLTRDAPCKRNIFDSAFDEKRGPSIVTTDPPSCTGKPKSRAVSKSNDLVLEQKAGSIGI